MTQRIKSSEQLRSHRWFGVDDLRAVAHRGRAMQMGYSEQDWQGKPVIAVINTWSDINQCHSHFKHRVEDVKRGVFQAGGFPLELPAMSLSEPFVKPSTMLYRNLLSMECEELLRCHPVDGVVLMGGCDKTTPALLMGAISMDLPTIFLPAGPMLNGKYKEQNLGSGSDVWKYWDERRAGQLSEENWQGIVSGLSRSFGHCMTMGTASTMTAIADAIGMSLRGSSSIPAPDSSHIRMSAAAGRRIVDMVWEDLKPSHILNRNSFENGIMTAMAMGCSTNAIIHLIAMARRANIDIDLGDFERFSRMIPVLANVRPSGEKYLMEDFYYAGGLLALLTQIKEFLHLDCISVSGRSLNEELAKIEVHNDDVIRSIDRPIYKEGALAVLKGNIAPDGCVIKPSAADPNLLKHTGPALVYNSYPEMKRAVDDETLDVTPDHILVLRNAGPNGGPGMPEWGQLPIPQKLLKMGVRDMVRLSDARMSGTSYGACILHVAPEAFIGGPLALIETGDIIAVNVDQRTINVNLSEEELTERKSRWLPPEPRYERGYGWMYSRHTLQANEGCDFDFLETGFGKAIDEPVIY